MAGERGGEKGENKRTKSKTDKSNDSVQSTNIVDRTADDE